MLTAHTRGRSGRPAHGCGTAPPPTPVHSGAALSQPSATKPPVASMQPCSSNITGSASCIASPVSSKHVPACNCGCTDPPCPQAVCLPPTYLPIRGLKLLQRGDDKHGGLAHARLGLADHVHAKDGLGDALVLHCDMAAGDKGGREAGLVGRKARARQAACHITPLPCSMLGTAPHAPGHPAHSRTKQAPAPSEGCSKPQSWMARSSSGLSKKSLKPLL